MFNGNESSFGLRKNWILSQIKSGRVGSGRNSKYESTIDRLTRVVAMRVLDGESCGAQNSEATRESEMEFGGPSP